MILCGAGDLHGALDRFYADVLESEAAIGVCFEATRQLLQTNAPPIRSATVETTTRRPPAYGVNRRLPGWLPGPTPGSPPDSLKSGRPARQREHRVASR